MSQPRSSSETCVLHKGQRVRFSISKRPGSDMYYVYFRGSAGQRLERTTKETNAKRAKDSALAVIHDEYDQSRRDSNKAPMSWDDAIQLMVTHMEAQNLRATTIDDYVTQIETLRKHTPNKRGPSEITAVDARRFKLARSKEIATTTLRNNLIAIRSVFNKWLIGECQIATENPFACVSLPKLDHHDPRVLASEEQRDFLNWLSEQWDSWRLPVLFLEVKGLIGCRIKELASLPSNNLDDGRIKFICTNTKGKKMAMRRCRNGCSANLPKFKAPVFSLRSSRMNFVQFTLVGTSR
jgi:integrase